MTVTCFLVTITGPKDCPHRHDQRSIGAKKKNKVFQFFNRIFEETNNRTPLSDNKAPRECAREAKTRDFKMI